MELMFTVLLMEGESRTVNIREMAVSFECMLILNLPSLSPSKSSVLFQLSRLIQSILTLVMLGTSTIYPFYLDLFFVTSSPTFLV